MKLNYYIKKLQEIAKDNPGKDLDIIYSHDGSYYKVRICPTEGKFCEDEIGWETQFKTGTNIAGCENAVCLN